MSITVAVQTLGPWVRISLKARMSVFILCRRIATGRSHAQGVKWNEVFQECPMLQVGATGIEEEKQ
jgi:hypothetical protein